MSIFSCRRFAAFVLLAVPLSIPAADSLPDRAHAVLKQHCYHCHGQDGTAEGGRPPPWQS